MNTHIFSGGVLRTRVVHTRLRKTHVTFLRVRRGGLFEPLGGHPSFLPQFYYLVPYRNTGVRLKISTSNEFCCNFTAKKMMIQLAFFLQEVVRDVVEVELRLVPS